jgi:hypothetical protein
MLPISMVRYILPRRGLLADDSGHLAELSKLDIDVTMVMVLLPGIRRDATSILVKRPP